VLFVVKLGKFTTPKKLAAPVNILTNTERAVESMSSNLAPNAVDSCVGESNKLLVEENPHSAESAQQDNSIVNAVVEENPHSAESAVPDNLINFNFEIQSPELMTPKTAKGLNGKLMKVYSNQ